MNFEDVIAPVTRSDFLSSYWEARPLVLQRHNPRYYEDLLSLSDVDHILTTTDLRYPALRLAREGRSIPLSEYTESFPYSSASFQNVPNVDRVIDAYLGGATLIFQALHKHWRPLSRLCRSIESVFQQPMQTNVYLTPKGSQGFAAHFDTHDVFVLQVHGAKHWRVYDSAVELPLKDQKFNRETDALPPLLHELDVRAGDLIYLPRGFVHEALTSDEESLHITLGLTARTWMDVFRELLKQCESDPRFRRALPMSWAKGGVTADFSACRDELMTVFASETRLESALDALEDRFVRTRAPMLDGRLSELHANQPVGPDTLLELRPGVIFRLKRVNDRILVSFHGKSVGFPPFAEPALRRAVEGTPFTARELPGNLDEPGRLTLCRRLTREGLLVHAG